MHVFPLRQVLWNTCSKTNELTTSKAIHLSVTITSTRGDRHTKKKHVRSLEALIHSELPLCCGPGEAPQNESTAGQATHRTAKEQMVVKKGCAQRLDDFPGGPTLRRFHLFPLEPLLGTFNTQSFGRCLKLRWCKTYFIQDESMSQWVVFVCLAISSRDWRFPSSSPIFIENIAHHLKGLRIAFIFNKTTKPDTTNNKRNIWLFP